MNKARALLTAIAGTLALAMLIGGCAKGGGSTIDTMCGSGQTSCDNACVDLNLSTQNCGSCGNSCSNGQSCVSGSCACGSGTMLCGTACVQTGSSHDHCGSCSNACSATQVCSNGACGTTCSGTQTACSGSCVDLKSDSNNCNSCGHACSAGQVCSNGACGCPSGQVMCSNGTCASSCAGGGVGGTTGGSVGGTTGGSTGGTTGGGTGGMTGGSVGGMTGGGVGGGTVISGNPPGYWKTSDWGVTAVDWHGCVWTGKDSTVAGSTTSVTPVDFTAAAKEGGPYEVSGSVFNDYNSVALLGFNLNEAVTGSSTQCKNNPAASTQNGPPVGTIPSGATGIAVNWSAKVAPPTSFRIQVQGVDGATNPAHTWCATITDAQGPSFIPFSMLNTKCYAPGTGVAFNQATDQIDAVAFLVPGTIANKAPFDFTIIGFAPGTSKADAPGGTVACGTLAGSLGSTTVSDAASFQRAAVTGTDCKEYIVQTNNWGNPTGSSQVINYAGSGFTVQSSSGSGSSAPASFPSTYIGGNGNIAGGTYNTWSDSGLPKQISLMQSVMTSFSWSGGTSGGQYNATYDVWFAKTPPVAGSYNDGVSGFVMVWLYQPSNFHPIGNSIRTATIAGHTWNVWVGPRGQGQGSTGGVSDGAGRPVISYVISGAALPSLSFDLKNFIDDAVSHGASDMTGGAGGITQAFSNTWYLTDVFAGFEIWNGSQATNLKSTGFSCVVK